MSINKVILIGRLGKDPEARKLSINATVCNFPLATREVYKKDDGTYVEQTEWHNIVMWRGIAERAERILKKGHNIYVEGKIKTRSWEDKDGNKRYSTEIVVENFQLLDKKSDSAAAETHSDTIEKDIIEPNYDDELPF
jgi:single-strand DNA-binding protein